MRTLKSHVEIEARRVATRQVCVERLGTLLNRHEEKSLLVILRGTPLAAGLSRAGYFVGKKIWDLISAILI